MPPASRRTTLCPTLTWGRKNIARFRQLLFRSRFTERSWRLPDQCDPQPDYELRLLTFRTDTGLTPEPVIRGELAGLVLHLLTRLYLQSGRQTVIAVRLTGVSA
jgi:hypothetical protein